MTIPLTIQLSWPAPQLSNTRVDRLGRRQPAAYPPELIAELRAAYEAAGESGVLNLTTIASKWGKSNANLCRAAKALGLPINQRRKKVEQRKDQPKFGREGSPELSAARSAIAKERIAKQGHPRGMLGKKHTEAVRKLLGEKSAAFWASLTEEQRLAKCDKIARAYKGPPQVARGSWRAGWREIGGKRHFYRSRWEANYARWLQYLKDEGHIEEWEYEPRTFWFDKIKRGVRSYKPDFRVTGGIEPGEITWHEVKGWMDARSKTTLRRMAKYYPDEFVFLVDGGRYARLEKDCRHSVPGWEL